MGNSKFSEDRNTLAGARSSKIVASVARDCDLDSSETRKLQVWVSHLEAAIASYKHRRFRRREGFKSFSASESAHV